MGGVARNKGNRPSARNSKASAKAIAAARGSNAARNKMIAAVVVVVVIAAAVIGGVLYTNHKKQLQANAVIKVDKVAAGYPVKLDGGVVEAGKSTAPITVNIYEDFICPYCGQSVQASGKQLEKALKEGKIKANFHMLNLLDKHSSPPGYSTRAANAAMAAAKGGHWAQYYSSLYANQPQEGTAGYSTAQLVSLGTRIGLGQSFADAVRNGTYSKDVMRNTEQAAKKLSKMSADGSWGTPTVLRNGKKVTLTDKTSYIDWVTPLVNSKS